VKLPAELVLLAGSALAVAGLVALAWLLGFRSRARIADAAELAALLAREEPAARIVAAGLDAGGAAAVAWLADGRVFVAKCMGSRIATRSFPAADVRVRARRDGVELNFADLGFPAVVLNDAPAWLRARAAA
jgi:hypothetical protein